MSTSSFFYGGSSAPEQNTVDELIDALNQKVAATDEDRVAAEQAALAAQASATSVEGIEQSVAALGQEAEIKLAQAQAASTSAIASANTAQTSATTAAVKASESASSANASAISATASAASASASATSAAASETAKVASEAARDAALVAKTDAEAAASSVGDASGYADAAALSATQAATSAANASSSESAASMSASSATTKATEAQASATSAASSASAALTSQNAAASSASAAATSATSAAASATTATDQATAANLFATSAFQNSQAAESSKNAAQTSATNASSYATAALTSKNDAASSASVAATSATNAAASELAAANSATLASAYESSAVGASSSAAGFANNANASATAAATSASNASISATQAENSYQAALGVYDQFDDRYLGNKTSDPTTDNDGNTLLVGALYFNSASNEMKVWNGSAWQAVSGAGGGGGGGVTSFNTRTGAVTLSKADVDAVVTTASANIVLGAGATGVSSSVVVGHGSTANATNSTILGDSLVSNYNEQFVVRVRQNPSPAPTGSLDLQYDPVDNEIYAVTGGGSGVTQIVAGTNITISSTGPNGTGVVTINSTGGGGGGGGPAWVTAKAFSSEPPQVAVPSGFDATTMTTQYVYAFSNMPMSTTPTGFSSFGGNSYFGSIYISYSMDWSSIVDPVVLSSFSPNSGTGGVVTINPADDSNSFADQPWSPSSYYSVSSSMPYDSLFITGTNKKGRAYTVLYGDFSSGITMPTGGTLISAEYSSMNNQTIVLTEYDDAAVSNIGAGMIPYFTLPFSPMGGALAFWYTYS